MPWVPVEDYSKATTPAGVALERFDGRLRKGSRAFSGVFQVSGGASIVLALNGDAGATLTATNGTTFGVDGLDLSKVLVAQATAGATLTFVGTLGGVVE